MECGSFYSKNPREGKTKSVQVQRTATRTITEYRESRRRQEENVASIWRRSDVPTAERKTHPRGDLGDKPTRVVSIYAKLFSRGSLLSVPRCYTLCPLHQARAF